MARSRFSSRTSKRMFYAGLAARYGASESAPAPQVDNAEVIIIDPDTNEAFPDAVAVSFSDLSAIIVDSVTPGNNENSKQIRLEDIFLTRCATNGIGASFYNFCRYDENGRMTNANINAFGYSRDCSEATYWTDSNMTFEYLTGETDRWGDEKVQRLTFTGSPGGGQSVYQEVRHDRGSSADYVTYQFAWRMPVGETAHVAVRTYNDVADIYSQQLVGTGDWVEETWSYNYAVAGQDLFKIDSRSGDTAQYIDIKNLWAGRSDSMRTAAYTYNDLSRFDNSTRPRLYMPVDYDANGNKLGLRFSGDVNIDYKTALFPYYGFGRVNNGAAYNLTGLTATEQTPSDFPHFTIPAAAKALNSPQQRQIKYAETTGTDYHGGYSRNSYDNDQAASTQPNIEYSCAAAFMEGTRKYVWCGAYVKTGHYHYFMVDLSTGLQTDEISAGTALTSAIDVEIEKMSCGNVIIFWRTRVEEETNGEYIYHSLGISDRATFTGDLNEGRPQYAGSTSNYVYHSNFSVGVVNAPVQYPNTGQSTGYFNLPKPFGGKWSSTVNGSQYVKRSLSSIPWTASEGTVLIKFKPLNTGAGQWVFYIGDERANLVETQYYLKIGFDDSGLPWLYSRKYLNTDAVSLKHTVPITYGQDNTIAIAWDNPDDFAITLNGETAATLGSGTLANTANWNVMCIGNMGPTFQQLNFAGWIKDLLWVPQRKSNGWLKSRSGNF